MIVRGVKRRTQIRLDGNLTRRGDERPTTRTMKWKVNPPFIERGLVGRADGLDGVTVRVFREVVAEL